MCFYIDKDKKYTAKKDIICYKAMGKTTNKTSKSIYMGYEYIIGKLYSNKNYLKTTTVGFYFKIINKGFHSCNTVEEAKKWRICTNYITIVKCIIPKGAQYYVNMKSNERVSNQIIIKEIIN